MAAEKAAEEPVAEAKEAVKPVVYTHPYYYGGYPYAGAYAYNYAPVTYTHAAVVKPYTYYANSGGAVHIVKKREAEADPQAWYAYSGYHPYAYGHHYGYAGYRYSPYTYGYRYGGYPYYSGYHGYYYGK